MKFVLIGAFFAIFSDVYVTWSYARKSAYNITGKWYLPRSSSPVFYLHFRDRISWIEADAVCQFHHSQLVTVDKPSQFEDVKQYLKDLFYEEPIWIGLRRNPQHGTFKWTTDGFASEDTDLFWKIKPIVEQEDSICVISSPSDDYRWAERKCNGPDVASFICEMPIPDWVQKSSCMRAQDENVTVTFHPQIRTVTAGKACQDSDVKYIECQDNTGKDEKAMEKADNMLAKHLTCSTPTTTAHESSSSSPPNTKIVVDNLSPTNASKTHPPTFLMYGLGVWERINVNGVNISSDPDQNGKSMETFETSSEPSTILPQEMSFAEEPIKASKPFGLRESTEQPEQSTNNADITTRMKFNSKNINFIPTPPSEKVKSNRSMTFVESLHMNSSESPSAEQTLVIINITNDDSQGKFPSTNATAYDESHEVFNNDKNLEAFQNSSPAAEKSVLTTMYSSKASEAKLLKDMVFDGSDEDSMSDRTYNIEGTFISNDFINDDPPISRRKKIDLTPLASEVKGTTALNESTEKSSSKTPVSKVSTAMKTTAGISFTTAVKISSSPSTEAMITKTSPAPALTTVYSSTERTEETSTGMESTIKGRTESDSLGNKTEVKRHRTASEVLMIADGSDEKKLSSRKRQIYSERHSFYPYFLGRILG